MKKRVLSLFLAFVMTLSLAAPAFAAEEPFLAEESAAREETAPAPAAPEDPAPMEAEAAAPASPVEEEPEPEAAAVDDPAPASVMSEPAADTPAMASTVNEGTSLETVWSNEVSSPGGSTSSPVSITMDVDATVSNALSTRAGTAIQSITVTSSEAKSIVSSGADGTVFEVNNEVTPLTLSGSLKVYATESATGPVIKVTNGTLTVNGSATVEHQGSGAAIAVEGGKLNVEGSASITSTSGNAITVSGSGEVIVNNGTVSSITVGDNGSVDVKNGTVSSITVNEGAKYVTISGGTIDKLTATGGGTVSINAGTVKTLDVQGGTVDINNECKVETLTISNGTVKITGGTYTSISVTIEGKNLGNLLSSTEEYAFFDKEDKGQNPAGNALSGNGPYTVKKKESASGTAPTGASNLEYKEGQGQKLLTADGTPEGGEMWYAVTTNEGSTPTAPDDYNTQEPKGQAADTYYVWWMVKGDFGHKNSVPTKQEEPKNPIEVTIAKQPEPSPKPNEGYTIDYKAETITVTDGYKVYATNTDGLLSDEVESNSSIKKYISDYDEAEKTLYIVKTAHEAANYTDSPATEITIPARPAAPNAKNAFEGLIVDSDKITLTNGNTSYEYAVDTAGGDAPATAWKPWEGTSLELSGTGWNDNATYTAYVRTPADKEGEKFASAAGKAAVVNGSALINEAVVDSVVTVVVSGDLDFNNFKWYYNTTDSKIDGNAKEIAGASGLSYTLTAADYGDGETGNYIWVTATSSTDAVGTLRSDAVQIGKGAASAVIGAEELTFNGKDQVLIKAPELTGATVKEYKIDEESQAYTDYAQVKKMNAGTYTVHYTLEATTGYTLAEDAKTGTVEVQIKPADTETALTGGENAVYDGAPVTLTATVTAADVTAYNGEHGAVTLTLGVEPVGTPAPVTFDGEGKGTATFALTNAELKTVIKDKAQFTATFNGDGTNLDASAASTALTVAVSPKPIAVTDLTFSSVGKDYDGETALANDKYTLNFNEDVVVENDKLTISSTGAELDGAGAGVHTGVTVKGLTLGGEDRACYELKALEADNSYTFSEATAEVYKVSATAVAPKLCETLIYSGGEQDLILTEGSSDGGTVQYAFKKDDSTAPDDGDFKPYSEARPKGEEAGTYTVWYRVQPDDNHTALAAASAGTVTIQPFTMSFEPVPADEQTVPYGDGGPKSVEVKQKSGEEPTIAPENIIVTYICAADGTAVEGEPVGPGVYEVWADIADRNFQLADGETRTRVCTLTITHTHKWDMTSWETWKDDERYNDSHWHPCIGPGECDMTDPSAIPGNANGYTGHPWPADAPYGWITDEDDECSHRICPDCGYEEDSRHQAAEPKVWQSEGPDGQHFLTCEKCTLPFDHEAHKWVADPEQEGVYKCSVCGEILEEADGGFPVSGKVTDSAGKGVMDAKVTLTSSDGETVTLTYMSDDGESELTADHVMTDHSGSFSFPDVVPGAYTLTVTTKDEKITVTKLVEVSSDGTVSDANVRLPRGDVSIQVDVDVHTYVTGDSDIPAVIVDGLLEAVTSDEDVIGSQKVEIEMSVTAQEESAFTEPDDKQAVEDIKDLAGGQGKNLSYLDVTILKTVNDGEPKELTETNSIITLVVPYEFSGRNNVTVYRYHDGAAAKLDKLTDKTKTANAFYLDSANGLIYIYANQFSVYAIGYTTPTYYPPLTAADKTELEKAVAAAEALNPEDYTAESWSALETALAAAKEAADFTWAAQEDVDAAAAALQKAIDALVKLVPAVDKSALEAAIAEAGALDPEDYTEETWAGVADALEAAKDVAADETATQEQVDDARKALDAAVSALAPAEVPEVDKGGLETAIDAAEALDPEDYTEESWAAVQEALEAAKDVAADESATQEDVDAAQKALDAAVGALVPAGEPEVDKSMLEQLIATAETVNEADCTPESWAFMAEALEVAKAIYADPDAPQEDVDAAVLVLFGAIMALEPAEPGIEPPAPPSSGTGWMENESGIYFYKDGELKKSYWVGKTDGASQWDGNWYYVDANGKLLTGMQYLTDLHGGMGWYFLQPTNANGEIGKMLTGWQWVGGEYGTGWFSQTEGSAGKCTYTTELGDWTGSAWVK